MIISSILEYCVYIGAVDLPNLFPISRIVIDDLPFSLAISNALLIICCLFSTAVLVILDLLFI